MIHFQSAPDIQLSSVAPRSCQHATPATPWQATSTGGSNQVSVADRSQTLGQLRTQHAETAPTDWAEEVTRKDPMARKVVLQSCMGSEGCSRPRGQVTAIHSLETNNSNIQDQGPIQTLCQCAPVRHTRHTLTMKTAKSIFRQNTLAHS